MTPDEIKQAQQDADDARAVARYFALIMAGLVLVCSLPHLLD